MQRHTDPRQRQQHEQILEVEGGGLEDGLHEGDVDESELGEEGDGDGGEKHFVLRQPASEAAVLEGGDEVEEDEAGECLWREECEWVEGV